MVGKNSACMTQFTLGVSTPEDYAMHASRILLRSLAPVLEPMHASRRRVLLQALEALIEGRRLTMTDLSRSWPGATFSHAPLKAVDRLLSNAHVQQAIMPLSQAMARWLLSVSRPVLVVDWVDLQRDGRWCALRAGMSTQGRTVTVYERIYPIKQINGPQAQREFLVALAQAIPAGVRPVLITDAGFRSDWFRAVVSHGWDYVGRVRNNVKARELAEDPWFSCSDLHEGATGRAEDLGNYQIVKGQPWHCRLMRIRRKRQGRSQLTRAGKRQCGRDALRHGKSAREPWLLATSLVSSQFNAASIAVMYGKRMQIEESFRDLKSHRYGMGFEDSRTRGSKRLSVLFLLNMLAGFAAWLLLQALKQTLLEQDPLAARPGLRGRYSDFRRSIEWLRMRVWPPPLEKAAWELIVARAKTTAKTR
jgi:hypothetical protein